MKVKQPLVSVLMNCYNGEQYLRPAIESVLAQTYQNWEIIFWDNQSLDGSADICHSYDDSRIKYFRADQHTNLGKARAQAFENVAGEFLSILDTDDLWLPTKLAKQVSLFSDPQIGIVISDTLFFTDDGRERRMYGTRFPKQGLVFEELVKNYFVSLETVMLRTSAIKSLSHAFDAEFSHVSDMDLIVRLSKDWKLACIPEVLAKWRVHQSSGTWLEPERFFNERNAFAHKMDRLSVYADLWPQSRRRFIEKTYLMKAVRLLVNGKSTECRQTLKECPMKSWRLQVIKMASWFPLCKNAIGLYQRHKHLT